MAEVFVPLNAFKSVITTLTGDTQDEVYNTPNGVSTIILSAQITNNSTSIKEVSILLDPNTSLPVPDFTGVEATGSYVSASALLELNKDFLVNETFAYTLFQDNLLETRLGVTQSFFNPRNTQNIEAIIYDIANDTTLRTQKAALGYYDKDGDSLIPTGQLSASLRAIDYANELAQQIILNTSVTASANVTRLYQSVFTQSFDETYTAESGSDFLISQLYNVVSSSLHSPNLVEVAPINLIKNVQIPSRDSLSPVVAGKLVLEQNYGLIFSGSSDLTVILSLLESANE
jgi:hypothetical protein